MAYVPSDGVQPLRIMVLAFSDTRETSSPFGACCEGQL